MSPYDILGVVPGAGPDEVRRAWRRRALETHPDRGGDEASFGLARQAFARLSAGTAGSGSPPVLVRQMDAAALAVRWARRRRHRITRPRVV